jgi:hypothetical protein
MPFSLHRRAANELCLRPHAVEPVYADRAADSQCATKVKMFLSTCHWHIKRLIL